MIFMVGRELMPLGVRCLWSGKNENPWPLLLGSPVFLNRLVRDGQGASTEATFVGARFDLSNVQLLEQKPNKLAGRPGCWTRSKMYIWHLGMARGVAH